MAHLPARLSRRELIAAAGCLFAGLSQASGRSILKPTPECSDAEEPTPPTVAGPFYSEGSPERASFLEPGLEGQRLVLAGWVLSTYCKPISGVKLDFWQADAQGRYDNQGFRLRGHQYTAEDGRYRLETIWPAAYTGRTRHLHVRLQRPGGKLLTTELFFPGEPRNATDGLFRPELLVTLTPSPNPDLRTFDFVLDLA